MASKKSKYRPGNQTAKPCCNCGATVLPGDGYNMRGSGYNMRPGGWGTRHGGEWKNGFIFICEPGKLLRLRAEERKENAQ